MVAVRPEHIGDEYFMRSPSANFIDMDAFELSKMLGDRYEILQLLGEGGMGEVYRAKDTRLERVVAIKVLPDGGTASTHTLERFQREARYPVSSINSRAAAMARAAWASRYRP